MMWSAGLDPRAGRGPLWRAAAVVVIGLVRQGHELCPQGFHLFGDHSGEPVPGGAETC
jgi:hypothetical protein